MGRRLTVSILIVVALLLVIEETAARRGGIGRSRSRSRGGSRKRPVYVSSSIYSARRPWGRGRPYTSWYTYGEAGFIYGFWSYRGTRRYRDYPDREPQICSNDYDYRYSNGTVYPLFICPTANLTEDYRYCCGEETRQRCCRYSDRGGVSIFGIIAALLVFLAVSAALVYCCCFRRAQTTQQPFFQSRIMSQRLNLRPRTSNYTATSTGPTVGW